MSSEETTPTRTFGRYELLSQISAGGMGEIYLARTRGAGGFEKKLVIKKILPSLAREAEFVAKFIDEANIVTHLTHGNIVPVFDMGEVGGEYYIAMEFIAGRDLRDVLLRCKAERWLMPVNAALFIVGEMCKGLAYAHRKQDAEGRELNIVHRDISPSNVLISKEGEIKLVDFGIAKARSRLSQSITGQLQGKFNYMSPEQASGKPLDRRSDIFSAGVVLYECLTHVRPFEGQSDLESLDRVRQAEVAPPSTLRPEIPAAVDAIVMRALARDPEARYERSDDMLKEILTTLYGDGGMTGPELAELLTPLFPEGLERDETRRTGSFDRPRGPSLDVVLSDELDRLLADPEDVAVASTATAAPSPVPSTPRRGLPAARAEGTVSLIGPAPSSSMRAAEPVRIEAHGGRHIKTGELEAFQRSVTAPFEAVRPALAAGDETPGEVAEAAKVERAASAAEVEASSASIASPDAAASPARPLGGAALGVVVEATPGRWSRPLLALGVLGLLGVVAAVVAFGGQAPAGSGEAGAVVELPPPRFKQVLFESDPPGAEITVNGKRVGRTNARVDIPLTGALVTLEHPETRMKWSQRLEANSIGTRYEVPLQAASAPTPLPEAADAGALLVQADVGAVEDEPDASGVGVVADKPDVSEGGEDEPPQRGGEEVAVRIVTKTPELEVFIDGVRRPLGGLRLKPGRYPAVFKARGYHAARRELTLPRDRLVKIDLEPEARESPVVTSTEPVKVTFQCAPPAGVSDHPYCTYTVGGKMYPSTGRRQTIELPVGRHTVEARGTVPTESRELVGSLSVEVTPQSAPQLITIQLR